MNRKVHGTLSLFCLALLAACSAEKPQYQGLKIGKPYEIAGREYVPQYNPTYDETGIASWYGPGFHGGRTANGERYDQGELTAAHKTLPLPSIVRVTNLDNGRSAIVRINDRGPFAHGRIIDLSKAAAAKLGVIRTGTARVRVQFLDKETREYVSNLPNGQDAIRKLDMLAQEGMPKKAVAEARDVAEADTGEGDIEDKPLPFAAPAYASGTQPQPTIKAAAYIAPRDMPARQKQVVEKRAVEQTPPFHPAAEGIASARGYFIQAGTFGVRENADRMLEALQEIASAKIIETGRSQKKLYRVVAGPYRSRTDAENMLSKLDTVGISGAKIIQD